MRNALQQYKNVNIESDINSASPYRITQLLMEGCIRFLKQAKFAIDRKDYEKKSHFISKSEAIVATLAGSLKRDESPDLSDNLTALYMYSLDLMLDASVNMDCGKIDEAISIIEKIKSGWDAIPKEEILKSEQIRNIN